MKWASAESGNPDNCAQSERPVGVWPLGAMALALALAAVSALSTGCGNRAANPAPAATPDLTQSIHALQTGQTIQNINADQQRPGASAVPAVGAPTGISTPSATGPATDPCAQLPALPAPVAAGATAAPVTDAQWRESLNAFGACLRTTTVNFEAARGALMYHIFFKRSVTDRALSRMSDAELQEFLKTNFKSPANLVGFDDTAEPARLKVRNSFEDRDLDELARLGHRVTQSLNQVEAAIFAAVDSHRTLVEHFALSVNRYKLLLVLRDSLNSSVAMSTLGQDVAQLLAEGHLKIPEDVRAFPVVMFHPWAVLGVLPDAHHETDGLAETTENPFSIVGRALAQMGGPDELIAAQRRAYTALRAADNPMLPRHEAPAANAVRVVVADTGVDFVRYPELGMFLSESTLPGSVGSRDWQDDDANPYLGANGLDGHGTGTTATVLTILSHFAPEALSARKVDLGVWKLNTVRSALGAPFAGNVNWESREALPEALIRTAVDATITVKPKIVSISAIFPLQPYLEHSHHESAMLQAPWLWVMAAGNEGVETSRDAMPVCLGDVPREKRVDARIICVGALKRGILQDRIAGYSNFGDRVDLYAFESYIDLCPNGTSCSTPAISGAAAAVAARYPNLPAEELKAILVEASEERTLEVEGATQPRPLALASDASLGWTNLGRNPSLGQSDGHPGHAGPVTTAMTRRVRVLDPATMMPRVFEVAARHAARARRR